MSRVIEDLDERERYLLAMLLDQSGVDMAEFSWTDNQTDDGLYRCWDVQIPWYRDTSKLQITQASRSVGKSQGIGMRSWAMCFARPGDDLLLTAPEMIHLRPVAQHVEERLLSSRLSREMLRKTKTSNGITKNPFEVRFVNGTRILGRIPQRDGRGIKGMHPAALEVDEGQDYPAEGYAELGETLKFGQSDSIWRISGVTTGLRNHFFKFSQPNSGWKVHRVTAVHRPDWSDEERAAKIEMYGGRDHPDYRRNIMGEHGDATSPLFVLNRLMSCCDDTESSTYNQEEYWRKTITNRDLDDHDDPLAALDVLLDFPSVHRELKNVYVGMDIGMTTDPTEILIFDATERSGKELFKLYARLTLTRLSAPAQRHVLKRIHNYYRVQAIGMDRTGLGLPIYSELVEDTSSPAARELAKRLVGYNFSEKIHVGNEMVDGHSEQIKANVIEISSDVLREMVDERVLRLPWDLEIIRDFQGQTMTGGRLTMNGYGKKRKTGFHVLDAARMAALAYFTRELRANAGSKFEPIMDSWL